MQTVFGESPVQNSDVPIRLFKSDALEFFTHIHPGVVLVIYVPVVAVFLARGIQARPAGAHLLPVLGTYATGAILWSLVEYVLHRFLFHYEPKHPRLQRVWFLIHGVHHEQPQCKTRLLMPPILSIPLAFLFYGLFRGAVGGLLRAPLAVAPLFAGFVTGYLIYDMMHYAEHHLPMRWGPLKYLKRYHLLHHFKTPEHRFGVSSPLWDLVFGTRPRRF
jgi:sterol desaturase/sphingolipid hydroxylase (fatty acid hydroxylase superfamily)